MVLQLAQPGWQPWLYQSHGPFCGPGPVTGVFEPGATAPAQAPANACVMFVRGDGWVRDACEDRRLGEAKRTGSISKRLASDRTVFRIEEG